MIIRLIKTVLLFSFCYITVSCEKKLPHTEKIEDFKNKLHSLSKENNNNLFTIHLESIIKVLNAKELIDKDEIKLAERMYHCFINDSLANPSEFQSYLDRKRTLIFAWTSPTDNAVSFSWLRLPKNWDKNKEYPLYIQLHGLWDVAANPISYMSYTFLETPSTTTAFEDGYFLSPWGRGNQWYEGISKTDIWECISELKKIAKVDEKRKYLTGHSMGGYGAWHIAQESPNNWAAIGIHSGAIWHENSKYITPKHIKKLKDIPIYFVWGDEETYLKKINLEALKLLENIGNTNLKVTEFKGGHDYNEIDVENMYNWMKNFKKN